MMRAERDTGLARIPFLCIAHSPIRCCQNLGDLSVVQSAKYRPSLESSCTLPYSRSSSANHTQDVVLQAGEQPSTYQAIVPL